MQTAKIFRHGGSQAVRLPVEFRFDVGEVFVWREPATGNVILSTRPASWADFLALRDQVLAEHQTEVDDLPLIRRDLPAAECDPFVGWRE